MVADDLALISSSTHLMQVSLDHAQLDASRERYSFNTTKTHPVTLNSKSPPILWLSDHQLEPSDAETHIGLTRTAVNNNQKAIANRIQKARRTSYSLMGAGLHGLNGTGPMVALLQYQTYVLPALLYGLEVLVLRDSETEQLELYHRKNLRLIQHLPQSTAKCALYLLSGQLPVEAQLHIKTLTLYRNIVDSQNESPPSQYIKSIVVRQLAVKEDDAPSWVVLVKKLLRKYHLPSAFKLLENTPTKKHWRVTIREAVQNFWFAELQEEARTLATMKIINAEACQPGKFHPIWRNISSQLDILKATVKAQLLVMRYPLASSMTAGVRRNDRCPLCLTEPETTTHFLLYCSALRTVRVRYILRITDALRNSSTSVDPDTMVKVILDSSSVAGTPALEELTRNFVYKLHHTRAKLLGGTSSYMTSRLANGCCI